jgi:hypothetical protein
MKKLITLLLLFTLVGFLSGNQVVITNDYEYIVSEGKTYNFNNGSESNNVKYDRTNKIAIQNNKVLADPLKYHYAFFWDEADSFIGYYKTNKGITTSGEYLGQVNTQSIPLPLNAYSFALVRYDNDYILVNGFTIEELFIDNNLAGVDPNDFNDIPIAELNGLTLNEVFDDGNFFNTYTNKLNSNLIETQDNEITILTGTSVSNFIDQRLYYNIFNPNDKLYIYYDSTFSKTFTYVNSLLWYRPNTGFISEVNPIITTVNSNTNYNFSYITNAPNELIGQLRFRFQPRSADNLNQFMTYTNIYFLNLSSLSIDSLTKAELDTYFSIYQNGVNATYYATDGNVSNVDGYYYAAGKNIFNSVLEVGDISTLNGTNVTITGRTRSQGFIQVKASTTYVTTFNSATNAFMKYYEYDKNFNFISSTSATNVTTTSNTYYLRFAINLADRINPQLEEGTNTTYEPYALPTTSLNLTFLFGLGNEPDKATIDGYYAAYEEYLEYLYVCCNLFATQTISFETIYFDDGVSTEIEQLGSILIFTLIGFTLMIFGFASKRRIFNLLSIGAFIVLGVLLAEFAGFLIIVFGLVVLNLYYTFLGDI